MDQSGTEGRGTDAGQGDSQGRQIDETQAAGRPAGGGQAVMDVAEGTGQGDGEAYGCRGADGVIQDMDLRQLLGGEQPA